MSAMDANAATGKENLTVRTWDLAGISVVKNSLTTAMLRSVTRQPVSSAYKLHLNVDVHK